jgi:prepilin-type N-terminal cleavage/methylation domain-containing protein
MPLQKGFSLIEVLLSLLLLSTVCLGLLELWQQSRLLLNHFIIRTQASHFLDEINEHLALNSKNLPKAPPPFQWRIESSGQNYLLRLDWYNNQKSLTRMIPGVVYE